MRQDEREKGQVTDNGKERDPGASEVATSCSAVVGPLAPGQRWTVTKKREVVLRIFRGESLDSLSRELGVEIYRLEKWRDAALGGIDVALITQSIKYLTKRLGFDTLLPWIPVTPETCPARLRTRFDAKP